MKAMPILWFLFIWISILTVNIGVGRRFTVKILKVGKKLASLIQNSISSNIDRENKRTPLSIEGIKIVDKTNIPVVIVECGFLSNAEDLRLLQTMEYQEKIVNGIVEGINEFYE